VKARGSDFRVGRVLREDDDFLTLEVAKNPDRELRLEEGDRFLTLLFVQKRPGGRPGDVRAWLPWGRGDRD